jgi:hypothetical protein
MDTTPEQRVARWHDHITALLGRRPRGLRDIAAYNEQGEPSVIRVASLVQGKPFPTLFWLVDPALNLAIDRLEAAGTIAEMQAQVDESSVLQQSMRADHDRHQRLRDSYLTPEERAKLASSGMMAALESRGIGGIAEPDRIRCLHTWYAAHLVQANTIGEMVDARLSSPVA